MGTERESRRLSWRNIGWVTLSAGLLGLSFLLIFRGVGAGDNAFNRDVGWANILALLVSAIGVVMVAMDKITAHGMSAARPVELETAGRTTTLAVTINPPYGLLPKPLRGRDKLRTELVNDVRRTHQAAGRRSAARPDTPASFWVLHGMGGVGKTAVALSVARSASRENIQVFWVAGDASSSFEAGMREAALRVGAPAAELSNSKDNLVLIDTVWDYLDRAKSPWVLIIDNADNPRILAAENFNIGAGNGWIRSSTRGTVILTSRISSTAIWGDHAKMRHVAPLSPDDGGKILLDLVKARESSGAGSLDEAKQLAARLGGLPLALRGAGNYLASPFVSDVSDQPRTFDNYRRSLDRQFADLVDAGTRLEHAPEAVPQERMLVMATWGLSLDLLASRGMPEARPLLRYLSCFAAQPIPWSLLDPQKMSGSPLWTQSRWRRALPARVSAALSGLTRHDSHQPLPPLTAGRRDELVAALANLTLLETGAAESRGNSRPAASHHVDAVSLHPMVAETTAWLTARDQRQNRYTWMTAANVVQAVQREAGDPADPRSWREWGLLAPHCAGAVRTLTAHAPRHLRRFQWKILSAAVAASKYQSASGQLQAAAETLTVCRDLALHLYGPSRSRTKVIRHTLGFALWDAGHRSESDRELAESLLFFEKPLRSILGPDFPDVHAKMHNLNRSVSSETDILYTRSTRWALRLQLMVFRRDSPRAFDVRSQLAQFLVDQGQLDAAEAEYRTLLDAAPRVLGTEHPYALTVRRGLAGVSAGRGNFEQAESEYRAVLETQVRVLGAEHPTTLATRRMLADTTLRLGNLQPAAVGLHAVEGHKTGSLESASPDGLVTDHRHAALSAKRLTPEAPGDYEAPKSEALAPDGEKPAWPGHQRATDTAALEGGNLDQAEAELRDVLDVETRTLGADHPNALATRHSFAEVLSQQGKLAEAEAEYRAVLEARQRVLGQDDQNTLYSRRGLASVLVKEEKYAEAEAEYQAVLGTERKLFADDHADPLYTRHSLAYVLAEQGKLAEAEAEYRSVLEAKRRILGPDDHSTLVTWHNLAGVLLERRDEAQAEAEYRAVADARKRVLGPEHPSTLSTRHSLADVMARRDELAAAEAEYRAVLEAKRRVLGPDDESTLATQYGLAGVLLNRGEAAQAESEFRRVLDAQTRVLGADHARTLRTRHNLLHAMADRGRHEEAETGFRTLLDEQAQVLGVRSAEARATRRCLARTVAELSVLRQAETAPAARLAGPSAPITQGKQANLLLRQGRLEEAKAVYQAALASHTFGPDHPDELALRYGLATVLFRQGKLAEADAEWRTVLAGETRIYGGDDSETLVTRGNLAEVHARQGNFEQALTEFGSVLDALTRTVGPEHQQTLATRRNLAEALIDHGDFAKARAELTGVLEAETRTAGARHRGTLATRYLLAGLQAREGKFSEAKFAYRAVLDAELRVLGADHLDAFVTRHNIAHMLEAEGNLGQAEAGFRTLLADQTRVLGPDDPNTRKTSQCLADVSARRASATRSRASGKRRRARKQ